MLNLYNVTQVRKTVKKIALAVAMIFNWREVGPTLFNIRSHNINIQYEEPCFFHFLKSDNHG
jgi:hypothetical protein